jgi:glutaredoxin-like protein
MMENVITIFGTNWCGDCIRARRFFEKYNIEYKWVDIDRDENGEEFVLSTNFGMRSVPTIRFGDGSILVEPTNDELKQIFGTILSSI